MKRIVLFAMCMCLLGSVAAVAQNAPEGIEMFPMELIPNLMDLGGGSRYSRTTSRMPHSRAGLAIETAIVAKGKGDIGRKNGTVISC